MENSMIDIIRGNTSSLMDEGFGIPPIINGNGRAGGSAVYNALENIVGSMLSRQRTRTTTYESERSLAAQKGWNLSQGQSAAMLAQAVRRGMRNL